jgi:hypothetical protein
MPHEYLNKGYDPACQLRIVFQIVCVTLVREIVIFMN